MSERNKAMAVYTGQGRSFPECPSFIVKVVIENAVKHL
jgi:LytS/YehU family sensor histidine kinase